MAYQKMMHTSNCTTGHAAKVTGNEGVTYKLKVKFKTKYWGTSER